MKTHGICTWHIFSCLFIFGRREELLECVESGEGMLRSYLGHGAEVLSEFTFSLFLVL